MFFESPSGIVLGEYGLTLPVRLPLRIRLTPRARRRSAAAADRPDESLALLRCVAQTATAIHAAAKNHSEKCPIDAANNMAKSNRMPSALSKAFATQPIVPPILSTGVVIYVVQSLS